MSFRAISGSKQCNMIIALGFCSVAARLLIWCSMQRNWEQFSFLYRYSVASFSGVDWKEKWQSVMLSLEAFQRIPFSPVTYFRSVCAFCCASRCVPGARSTSLLLERQLILSIDANRNESSVTPMFSGLASFQCKVSVSTSFIRRGILILFQFLAS